MYQLNSTEAFAAFFGIHDELGFYSICARVRMCEALFNFKSR